MVKVVKVGPAGKWPLEWELSVDTDKLDEAQVEAAFAALTEELEEIDGAYYRHAVSKEDWAELMSGAQRICAEEHGGAVTQLMTCLCFGVMESPADASARRMRNEILENLNKATKGKFNRKVEWGASSFNDKVRLTLNARKAYAKWVANDREKMRRQNSDLRKHKVRNLANAGLVVGKLGFGIAKSALRPKVRRQASRNKAARRAAPQTALETAKGEQDAEE